MNNFGMNDFDDVQVGLAALLYYIYRHSDCPYGNNLAGLNLWVSTAIIAPFEELADEHE